MCVSRWLSLTLLSCPRLELLKITKDVDEGCVRARWRLVGRPRLLPFADRWVGCCVSSHISVTDLHYPLTHYHCVCACLQVGSG